MIQSKNNCIQVFPAGDDSVMRKLFIGPFYRQNAGTFLFLYVLFLGSFLFINYLGEMPASESFFWHFVLLIFMVTHQFMVVLFICLSAFYLFKTRIFVKSLLGQQSYGMLKESLGTLSGRRQWWCWFKVQLWLSLPLLIYALACLAMAVFYGRPLYGIVIIIFLLTGILTVASLNFYQLNRFPGQHVISLPTFGISWKRLNRTSLSPVLYAIKREPSALIITKVATILFSALMVYWQNEAALAIRQWWLSFLLVSSAHVVVVYKISLFMHLYCKDLEGLPLKPVPQFLFLVGKSFVLLLLPELLVLILTGYGGLGFIGISAEWSLLVFYHYFSAYLDFSLKALLKSGFLILCVAFVLVLYGLFAVVVVGYLVIAWFVFRRRYYCLP